MPRSRLGATVVSGVDAPPVLESAEHVLDFVALSIEDGVVGDGGFPIGFGGDAGGDFVLGERFAEPIGVVALVGQKLPSPGHRGQHQRRALEIAHLTFA